MSYEVDPAVATKDDWANTTWTVVLKDTSYLLNGAEFQNGAIEDSDEFQVTVTQSGQPYTWPGKLLANGQVVPRGTTMVETTTASGTDVPAGTPIWLINSMVILEDTDTGARKKYVQGLTLVDDPEDAGIMGAEEGGGE